MDLRLNDIVLIEKDKSKYIEAIVYVGKDTIETRTFIIYDDYTASKHPLLIHSDLFRITKVWRLDESGNYILIYPETKKNVR